MTFERLREGRYQASFERVLNAMRKVLAHGFMSYRFRRVRESADSTLIRAVVIPWLWPLTWSTKMEIRLGREESQTTVTIRTMSQKAVLYDIFGIYRGYINAVLEGISIELRSV